MTRSEDLQPGTRLRHRDGKIVTLGRRKTPPDDQHGLPYWPGWWLRDESGGLADFVIDHEDSDWTVLGTPNNEDA